MKRTLLIFIAVVGAFFAVRSNVRHPPARDAGQLGLDA